MSECGVTLPERAREGCSNSKAQNPNRAFSLSHSESVKVKVARYVLQIRCLGKQHLQAHEVAALIGIAMAKSGLL